MVEIADDPGNTGHFSLPLLARLAARRDSPDALQLLERAWANAVEGDSLTSLVPGSRRSRRTGFTARALRDRRARVAVERLHHVPGRAR